MTGDKESQVAGSRIKSSYLWLAIDNIFATFVIGPLVVFYWRGTWTLLDIHLYPEEEWKSAWICVAIGNGGLFMTALLQEPLAKYLKKDNWVVWITAYHIYSYVVCFFSVCHWRGIWASLNHYTGKGDNSMISSLVIGQALLWLLRTSKLVAAPPMLAVIDTHPDFFVMTSRFNAKSKTLELYILDHLLTVVVIWNSVVLMWRGVWGLADNYFFPDDIEKSCWMSLGLGFGFALFSTFTQIIGNMSYRQVIKRGWHPIFKVIIEDLVIIIGNFAAINHWRGVWVMQDVYILPEQKNLSCWITHGVGIGGLFLILAGNSITTRGCLVTGSGSADTGCLFENYYFRYFLSKPPLDGHNSSVADGVAMKGVINDDATGGVAVNGVQTIGIIKNDISKTTELTRF